MSNLQFLSFLKFFLFHVNSDFYLKAFLIQFYSAIWVFQLDHPSPGLSPKGVRREVWLKGGHTRKRSRTVLGISLGNTVSPLHMNLQVANLQRCEHACQPLYASCCTVLPYLSRYCTVKINNVFFIFCVCFYVHIICVKSIINLLQYSII